MSRFRTKLYCDTIIIMLVKRLKKIFLDYFTKVVTEGFHRTCP